MTPGATRRRETTETVRDRMSNLFASDGGDGVGEADVPQSPRRAVRRAATPPREPDPDLDADPDSDLDPDPDLEPDLDPQFGTGRRRRRLGLPPGMLLDRRAILGLTVLLLLGIGYAVQHFWLGRPQPVPVPVAAAATNPAVPPPHRGTTPPNPPASGGASAASAVLAGPSGPEVVVDVAGKVQHPGLRTLPSGSRVADALRLAGGPLPDTETDSVNLARVLTDGEQIVVGAPAGLFGTTGQPTAPLSLNHATVDQLDALPGVGPSLAQRITLFRREHGGFRSVDQLRQVSGIGDRKFLDLRPLLTL